MIAGASLSKTYGHTVALDGVDVQLAAGRVTALLGPNGAGKTTLIRLLHLLDAPDEGRVTWDGRPVDTDDLDVRRRMALVAQDPHLFRGTVRDNVALPLKLRGRSRDRIKSRVDALLGRFDLADLADRDARRLSGGQAQRLALARALAPEPDVLFLDEFASNLDRERLLDCEAAIREEAGDAATVLVSHDRDQVHRLADDAVLLADGQVAARGEVKRVLEAARATNGSPPGSARGRRQAPADRPD